MNLVFTPPHPGCQNGYTMADGQCDFDKDRGKVSQKEKKEEKERLSPLIPTPSFMLATVLIVFSSLHAR